MTRSRLAGLVKMPLDAGRTTPLNKGAGCGPQTPQPSIIANEDRRMMVDRTSKQGEGRPGTGVLLRFRLHG